MINHVTRVDIPAELSVIPTLKVYLVVCINLQMYKNPCGIIGKIIKGSRCHDLKGIPGNL